MNYCHCSYHSNLFQIFNNKKHYSWVFNIFLHKSWRKINKHIDFTNVLLFQEQLLLNVLPVHIAVELKNKMLNKLRNSHPHTENSREMRETPQKHRYRFHELYVKVHENVRWDNSLHTGICYDNVYTIIWSSSSHYYQ